MTRYAMDDQPLPVAVDRLVSMDELREIWADLQAKGQMHNGMTHAALRDRYGDRVYHTYGKGWFVREEAS